MPPFAAAVRTCILHRYRYRIKNERRVADKHAVRTGNASEQAFNRVSCICLLCCVLLCNCNASYQVQVIKACTRSYGDMAAMLRGLKMFDGIAFEEVPEQFKQGLACQEHFYLVAANRTADKIADRAAEIVAQGLVLQPHSQEQFDRLFDELTPPVEATMLKSLVTLAPFASILLFNHQISPLTDIPRDYLAKRCVTGDGFFEEITRWAHKGSTAAIRRKDGVEISSWKDLEEIGFKVRVRVVPLCSHPSSYIFTVGGASSQLLGVQCQGARDGAPSQIQAESQSTLAKHRLRQLLYQT